MGSDSWDIIDKIFSDKERKEMSARIKELEYDCAELVKENDELRERVKKLASRQPSWPKGYRPSRRHNNVRKNVH